MRRRLYDGRMLDMMNPRYFLGSLKIWAKMQVSVLGVGVCERSGGLHCSGSEVGTLIARQWFIWVVGVCWWFSDTIFCWLFLLIFLIRLLWVGCLWVSFLSDLLLSRNFGVVIGFFHGEVVWWW